MAGQEMHVDAQSIIGAGADAFHEQLHFEWTVGFFPETEPAERTALPRFVQPYANQPRQIFDDIACGVVNEPA